MPHPLAIYVLIILSLILFYGGTEFIFGDWLPFTEIFTETPMERIYEPND